MAGTKTLVSRDSFSSCNLSDVDCRSSAAIYDLNEALTLEDMAEVYSSLFEVRSKWFNIGLELGVHLSKLNGIEREGNDDGKALRKMLEIALKDQRAITGQRICDALRKPIVDESVLAQNLENSLPDSVISRRQQTTNFTSRASSKVRLTSNTSSSSIDTSHKVSSGTETRFIAETRSSPKEAEDTPPISLPDVVISNIKPQIKRLPSHFTDEECTHCFKVNIVGDPDVGKSTMLLRFMKPSFAFGDSMVGPTLLIETVGVCVFQYNEQRVKLYLWDTTGCEQNFDAIPNRFFSDVHGTIIMFDVSTKQTLINTLSDRGSSRGRKQKSWIKEVDYRAEDDNVPVKLLVGGKIDIKEREVTTEEAETYASQYGLPYLEVSAKESLGIQEVFYKMVELLMDKFSGQHTVVKYWTNKDTEPLLPGKRGTLNVADADRREHNQTQEQRRCRCQ